jgi:outer membrane immunogenic protein
MHRFQYGVLATVTAISFASIAAAADMPLPAAAAAAPAVYDWSGFYVGGHVGGGWASNSITDNDLLTMLAIGNGNPGFIALNQPVQTVNSSGFLGGVQAGANYQIGKLVVGAEADYSWGTITGSNTAFLHNPRVFAVAGINRTLTADTIEIGTMTTRLGVAHDRWLLYGKAGAAWARTNYAESDIPTPGFLANPVFTGTATEARVGWTVGAGLEWAFWNTWSAKLEYDYLNFGARTTTEYGSIGVGVPNLAAGPAPFNLQNYQTISEVKFGINYKFMANFW